MNKTSTFHFSSILVLTFFVSFITSLLPSYLLLSSLLHFLPPPHISFMCSIFFFLLSFTTSFSFIHVVTLLLTSQRTHILTLLPGNSRALAMAGTGNKINTLIATHMLLEKRNHSVKNCFCITADISEPRVPDVLQREPEVTQEVRPLRVHMSNPLRRGVLCGPLPKPARPA